MMTSFQNLFKYKSEYLQSSRVLDASRTSARHGSLGPRRASIMLHLGSGYAMADSMSDLPPEVILSIERVLNIQNAAHPESLDTLSSYFKPIHTLNELFPDGQCGVCPEHELTR